MAEHITTSVDFEHAVHSIEFQENGKDVTHIVSAVLEERRKNLNGSNYRSLMMVSELVISSLQ